MAYPLRGEIWLVQLDPTVGAEIKKTRPAVIVSNNINNQYSATVTVAPVSNIGKKVYPFEVRIDLKGSTLKKESKVRCQQIRTIDKKRLLKKQAVMDAKGLTEINTALALHLGLQVDGGGIV